MKIDEIVGETHIEFIEDLISNPLYDHIRTLVDYLLPMDEREFSYDFEYLLAKAHLLPISGKDPESLQPLNDATEKYFLSYLDFKIMKAIMVLENYFEHATNIGKPISKEIEERYDLLYFQRDFLHLRMRRSISEDAITSIENTLKNLERPIKEPRQNTLNGKKINLLERYEIANKMFGIDKKIRSLKILDSEKYKLLSLIFDCNPTNARHVMNGKYPANVRENLISPYIEDLMK